MRMRSWVVMGATGWLMANELACAVEEWMPGSTEPPPEERAPAPPAMLPQAGSTSTATNCPAGFACRPVITGETVCVKTGEAIAPSCVAQADCTMLLPQGTCKTDFGMTFCVQSCRP